MRVSFEALEHQEDGGFAPVSLAFAGSPAGGWQVERNGEPHLGLGPGFELLASRACGVCATDLARRFLPFPLPQVIGHEVLAEAAGGERRVVEINASCVARGQPPCPTCAAGLPSHCPERRVLGIHDLPGGFGPFVLAPVGAVKPVPAGLPDATAALVEPFAAALHAVRSVSPRDGERVAVLGPRRLGMLVIAALAAERRHGGGDFGIVAVVRRPALASLARELGADEVRVLGAGATLGVGFADVVVDTTGAPEGLALALRAARREVHVKSTHGRPAGGLANPTALVVDELRVERLGAEPAGRVAWSGPGPPPPGFEPLPPGAPGGGTRRDGLAGFDAVVVADAAAADRAIRPDDRRQVSWLAPRGTLVVHPDAVGSPGSVLGEVAGRGLVVSSSRCGDFQAALDRLSRDPRLTELGPRLVSHRFGPGALAEAFEAAASPRALKVLVEHPRA